MSNNLEYESYNESSFKVTGNRQKYSSILKNVKARWNPRLKNGGEGWIVSKNYEKELIEIVEKLNVNDEEPDNLVKKKNTSPVLEKNTSPILEKNTSPVLENHCEEEILKKSIEQEDITKEELITTIESHVKSRENQEKYHRSFSADKNHENIPDTHNSGLNSDEEPQQESELLSEDEKDINSPTPKKKVPIHTTPESPVKQKKEKEPEKERKKEKEPEKEKKKDRKKEKEEDHDKKERKREKEKEAEKEKKRQIDHDKKERKREKEKEERRKLEKEEKEERRKLEKEERRKQRKIREENKNKAKKSISKSTSSEENVKYHKTFSEKPNKFKAIYQNNEVSSSSEEISSDNVDLNDISDCSESNSDKNNSKDEISENESHDEISEENNSCDSDDYDKLFKKVKNLQKKLTKK